jgi:organic hydroperoxide reductase OsmC/OhrA
MHPFPHRYAVTALASASGVVTLRGDELEDIQSTPPPEFDGPPGNWSPESLFVAAIADCFVLSFRAVARASKLEWLEIDCGAEGTLDKTPEGTMFTAIELRVKLRVPAGSDAARATRLLEKAEQVCLVSNSIKPKVHLVAEVAVG